MSVYTPANLKTLFTLITEQFGPFNPNTWTQSPPKNSHEIEGFTAIYARMLASNCWKDSKRPAESPIALQNQMRWATSTQPEDSLNTGQRNTRRRNRLAAYCSGFMTMTDILTLEAKESLRSKR